MSPRGRRAGAPDTRALILSAARAEFSQRGYDGTSLRGIARAAGVDPKLVHHYFDGKSELVAEVLAFPMDPSTLIETLVQAPREEVGEGLVRAFLAVWDSPTGRQRFAAMFAAAAANEELARMVREFVGRELIARLIDRLDGDGDGDGDAEGESGAAPDPAPADRAAAELRAATGAAQLIGMGVLRYVVKLPAMADASVEEIVATIGPTLQGHLVPLRR